MARDPTSGLAQRVDVAQRERPGSARWLRERHQDVPDPLAHYEMGHDIADIRWK
jgi:hypothetical protein